MVEKKETRRESGEAFDCQMCGHCCEGEGGIVMSARDEARLMQHLGMSREEFSEKCVQEKGGRRMLAVNEQGYCLFFQEGCGVHPAKPAICCAWPFFRGNLIDKISWELAQEYCPGINNEAGHAEFVRQGVAYLKKEGLLDDAVARALKLEDEHT